MTRPAFRVTEPMVAVLAALRDHPDGITGYEIRRVSQVNGPTVYNILKRLDGAGWVTSKSEPSPFPGSPNRKTTVLTNLGKERSVEVFERHGLIGGLVGRG